MPKGLRSALKNAHREIIARVESGTAPDWVADNCCVIDKYCRAAFKAHQAVHIGIHVHLNRLAEQFYLRRAVQKQAPQRPLGLISHKQNGGFRPPQVVF